LKCARYYVGNAKVVRDAIKFHTSGIWWIGDTNGAHHCKPCMIYM
jgi:hypothetical protein